MNTYLQCPACGKTTETTPDRLTAGPVFCSHCGNRLGMNPASAVGTPPPPMPSNPMAVASLVLSLCGCIPLVPGILGLLFGIIGIRKANRIGGHGLGLAIAGVVISAFGLLLTPVMIAILMPALVRARETANRVQCATHMRTIAQAAAQYASAHNGHYPDSLNTLLRNQPLDPHVFLCGDGPQSVAPGSTNIEQAANLDSQHCSFIYVGRDLTTQSSSSDVVLYEPLSNHGNDGSNMVFADSHVEFMPDAVARPIIQRLQNR